MKMSSKRKANVSYYNDESSSDDEYDYDIRHDSARDCDLSSKANSSSNGSSINHNENEEPIRRRGRAPSKRPCLNRNALMARQNRQKKKEYLENVENKLTYYRTYNTKLVNILKKQDINLKRLNAEVKYLKNVLKNNTSITALLNSMNSAINNKNCNKNINKCTDLEVMNDRTLVNSPEKNTMVKDWMNHGIMSINNDNLCVNKNKGRDLSIVDKSLDSFIESEHAYASSHHENDELFDFEGVDCDLQSSEIVLLENNNKSADSKWNNFSMNTTTTTPQPAVSSSSVASSASSSSCNMDGFNTEAIKEESSMIPFHVEDDLFDDYLKCDSNTTLDADDLFGNLDTSGVCLHVNAGKISLEFCSICHLNSINSEDL